MIRIVVYENSYSFIRYLISHDIWYSDLEYNNKYYRLNIKFSDYKSISRRYDTKIVRYFGKLFFINFISYHKYMIISFVFGMFILSLLMNTIFDIKVNTDEEELKNKIISSLNDYGITKNKRVKSYEEIVEIKNNILNDNEDILDWIEITRVGSSYVVDVTPRVVNDIIIEESEPCDIVASKSGLITHIVVSSGTKLKEVNEYVNKGDVIVSGNIIKNEEIISGVHSKADVYGEVWYLAKVSIPYNYEINEEKKKINRYYLNINDKEFTILGYYNNDNTIRNKFLVLDKPYLFFKLYKEEIIIYDKVNYKIDESEAYNQGLKYAENKIKESLDKEEYVISKKVLKKVSNSSKMELEVFFKVYENIGVTSKLNNQELNNENSNQ